MSKAATKKTTDKVPVYMKYANTVSQNWLDPASKLKPSDLAKPSIDIAADDYPMIIEFNNMADNTSYVHSVVDIDQPLFQPSPKIVVFEEYGPFNIVEKKIYFRNKDSVNRRIKIMKPDSPFFEVSAPKSMNGEPLVQTKIAPGMEIYFVLTFRPQEVRDYSFDLVCSTEREKFLVPIRAVGTRPMLTLPDQIDFGSFPIKSPSQKKLMVQNVGTAVARFNMRSSNPLFSCPTQDLAIEAGASESIELFFTPSDTQPAEGEIAIEFHKGVTCYIAVCGVGRNADVSLSTPSLTLEPSYISLLSQKSLRIRNLSDSPISYMWKSFSCEIEEDAERHRLQQELNRMEEMEHAALRQRIEDGFYNSVANDDEYPDEATAHLNTTYGSIHTQDYPGEGGEGSALLPQYSTEAVPFAAKADQAALVRKYRNLRKALEKDDMQFVDDIFEISPIEGQVWAHSEIEITVCFRPDTAALYNCLAFLDVSGRHDRLALQLTGQGIGPHAALSCDVLDIGDVYVNDESHYEIKIKNKGDIPAQWTFLSSLTKFGNKFKFSPTEGYLKPSEAQKISIAFESDILGEFSEHFRFALQGNEDMLVCQIKGHVTGPNFHFDCTSIDYGVVSFDYLHSTRVTMVNTSTVPMVYSLHIPQDGTYLKKEFNIEPAHGTLGPSESVEVLVEFIPNSVKVYAYSLAVDVLGVGDVIFSLPITADCVVSTVKLELPAREIDFGDVFIRYPYEQVLTLTNLSPVVRTKFEIMPQLKQTKSVGTYETEPSIAVIEPGDSMQVKVRLIAQKLGPFKVPMTINVAGSKEPPLQAVISFNTVGPKISLDMTEMRWGNIECLKDASNTIKLTNIGLTTASMRMFLKMARSCYRLAVRELVLDAGQSYDLVVTANLDDSVVSKDEIHIVVDEGDNLMVPLVAKGIGTTMYCKQEVDVLDLGVQLTNNYFEKQIVLENKGRRPQQLKWTNQTVKIENLNRAAKAKKLGKDTTAGQRLPKNLSPMEPMFTVTPEEIILRSRTATTFTFKGFSATPKQVNEIFILESKVGKDRYMKQIIETDVRCNIVNPLLEFSVSEVDFLYTWERDVHPAVQKRDLTLTNTSSITLSFTMKTEIPFNLNSWEATLAPGQHVDIEIEFDPVYKDDKVSHVVDKLLSIVYRGHPQKDSIPLRAEVIFPNLVFDHSVINFGCVLNDTSKTLKVRAANSCKIDVNYEWIFLESAAPKHKARGSVLNILPPSQVFDILPVKSLLRPGASEDVEFSLYGNANTKFTGVVLCVVEGGPEYKFPISGEASTVSFSLNRSIIDFGKVVFTEKGDEELEIINHGKVPFNFSVVPATGTGAQIIELIPPSGKVPANSSSKVVVRVRPGLPVLVHEQLVVNVAHFDPVLVSCYCQGTFPCAVITLPHYRKIGPYGETENVDAAMWDAFHAAAVANVNSPDASLLPPMIPLPAPASGSTANPPVYEPMVQPPVPPAFHEGEDNIETASLPGAPAASLASNSVKPGIGGVPHAVLEVEMQRMVLARQLADKVAGLNPEFPDEGATQLADYNILSPRFGLQALIAKNLNIGNIVASHYVCDFGNVIAGQTRKKIFKITNASLVGKLNWVFDKKHLAGSGFSIEPEKVAKMVEGSTLDFTLKFFARMQLQVGQRTNILPLENPGSPTINIVLTANVCVPEVEVSATDLDFGRVLIGRSTKMYVLLQNPTPVTSNWQLRKVPGKDDAKFTVEPSAGSLRPGKKMLVCIEFMPTESHKVSLDVQVKVDLNKKIKNLKIVGEGFGAPLKFEPSVVELGPILPYTDGDEKVVTVFNNSDVDVEFFSTDFDPVFRDEETKLNQIATYDEQGVLRTSLRLAGEPLPADIQAAYDQVLLDQAAVAAAAAAPTATTAAGGASEPAAADVAESTAEGEAPAEDVVVFEEAPVRTKPAPRDERKHQDFVFLGPPVSGVSSHAQQMSRKLQLSVKTFDEVFKEVARTSGPMGYIARLCTNTVSASERLESERKLEELIAIAEQSKLVAEEAYKKEKKGKAKEIPPEVYLTPEVAAIAVFTESQKMNVENLAKLLQFRMSWEDAGHGLIFDGIFSSFVEPATLLKAIELALPDAILTHISINRGEEGYAAWLSGLHDSKTEEMDRLFHVIAANKKLFLKTAKPTKVGKGAPTPPTLPLLVEGDELSFAEALPAGDESWISPVNGHVMELESNEFKSLEEKEKLVYLRQVLYQLATQIKQIQVVLANIARIWSPQGGLVSSTAATVTATEGAADGAGAEEAAVSAAEVPAEAPVTDAPVTDVLEATKPATSTANAAPVILYADYASKVLPVLPELKKGSYALHTPVPVEDVPATEGETVLAMEYAAAPVVEDATVPVEPAAPAAPPAEHGGLYEILIDGDEPEDAVFGAINALLPPPLIPPPDKDAIPAPSSYQIHRKPAHRANRRPIKLFKILDMEVLPTEEELAATAAQAAQAAAAAADTKNAKKGAKGAPAAEPEPVAVVAKPAVEQKYRWVIPAHGSIQIRVKFASVVEGKPESTMEFEVVGTHQKFTLPCKGVCEFPHINTDTRNIFMRRVKGLNPNPLMPLPNKRFVIAENFYSFGPLSLFKKPEWKMELTDALSEDEKSKMAQIESTHMDIIRVTNNGLYKCQVDLGLLTKDEESREVFLIEPPKLELEEGETKEVKLWALPKEVKEYRNNLVLCVSNNPAPLVFPLKCWGADPTMVIEGPWGDAVAKAEKALADNTDKKATKDLEAKLAALKDALTLDFERILIGKSDTRQFTIKNTSLLPIQWEIEPGDFKDSANITIEPMSGLLPINTTLPVVITFTSPDPLMLTGKFTLKYSDHEGGLKSTPPRVTSTIFRAVAEAYKITAVSLNSQGSETGGSEIDYGLIRVGDNAVQTMKMGNKGKYQIGYAFKLTTPLANSLLTISPMEGLIETGTSLAEIKVTICSKDGELLLKNNKDVMVEIIEPLTKEVVEKFPLFISAQAKYSKFRLQPSKGISFGAVRFDSEHKTKRVELRNEGAFELTYVVCPAISEHDELDSLDAAAFGCYAQATPQALRAGELGESYIARVKGGGGDAGAKSKKVEKPPAKGKGAPVAAVSTLNPLVVDPDELPPGSLPEDPLVVGAFTVTPRVGTVLPGQSVGIDMKFDPSGCETVKERMRLCVSGADPKDALTVTVKTFEVTGESCVPAIVNEDVNSIFEEQEIVHSLADSTGEKSSEGGGKVEKLAVGKVVYAETEKMLAFGPVSCGLSSGRGVVERVKISNPTKIDIKVKFNVLTPEEAAEKAGGAADAAAAKGGKGGKDAGKAPAKGAKGAPVVEEPKPNVFTVQPQRWEIPPHEHRFVNVYFNPTEIKSYRAVFLAQIDDEGIETSAVAKTANSGKSLTFELGGSGTLPCIAFDQPTEFTPSGDLLIKYSKVLVNRSSRKKMVIRNDGVMPATCLFDMIGDDDFVFPAKGTSLTVNPGCKEDVFVNFSPKAVLGDGNRKATIKVSVLNNQFDNYKVQLVGTSYSCDAIIDTIIGDGTAQGTDEEEEGGAQHDVVPFADINLADGPGKSTHTVLIRSKSNHPVKFELARGPDVPDVLQFSPSVGHLAPNGTREVNITFSADVPVKLVASPALCTFKRIAYTAREVGATASVDEQAAAQAEQSLWGVWDDSMKSVRAATAADVEKINTAAAAMKDYMTRSEAEKAKGKKGKPVGPPPDRCLLELGPPMDDGTPTVYEIVAEPIFEPVKDAPEQQLSIVCNGTADIAKYTCEGDGQNITFTPTFLFQNTVHKFSLKNESNVKLPVKWLFEDLKRRGQTRALGGHTSRAASAGPPIPCPFSIDEEDSEVAPNSSKQFAMKFFPLEVDDFMYLLRGITISTAVKDGDAAAGADGTAGNAIRMIIRGTAKRPICHFDIQETDDYMSRRPLNMKNENGLNSPIEVTDIKVVELESVGLRTRNTFRFHITNPTNDNYEFLWETMGEASPFWRCVQGAGMMFAGKRVEVVFEFLPEEVNVAEAFFKFRIPSVGLEQVFLFTGKVAEPKVLFSTSKIDFHSVMLGGEGSSETIYLENKEHLPFQFAIDKYSLLQLDGPNGPVLDIVPKQGTVPPYGKMAIHLHFHPQEEVVSNFNIVCTVKRKPNKLSLNIKGEGYAVHPFIQLEQAEESPLAGGKDVNVSTSSVSRYMTLRPAPAVNYADFGAVQVLDTIAKTLTVTNNGKFNFDYAWDIDNISPMLSLTGGKMGGTLLKADELNYKITFAPNREGAIENSMLTFTVAGKYVYNIVPRGSGVKPALRFSFMHHDFGPCFVTSPGGSTVIEEIVLHIVNHDPKSNIAVECTFQKTRALWAECAPTVIAPGGTLDVPIRFAPREVKDYAFVIPFVVNGATKVPVNIIGNGINARLELVNGSQRRTNFGLVNVGSSTTRTVAVVNRSKRALPVQLIEEGEYGSGALKDRCVTFMPKDEFTIAPRETVSLQLMFNPSKRISQFTEDLSIRYAGVTRKLLTLSGKAQGAEIALDSDSLPFGVVVLESQKIKKLALENTGDLTITFQWQENTFGKHFTITPLSGKILPGNEASFDVIFKPKFEDEDIRQDNIILNIPGIEPLKLTCTGSCILPPTGSTQTLEFKSLARKAQDKTVKISNPTDKDWYVSPSLQGDDWKVPHEFKIPAKGSADLPVTYYPLTMSNNPKRSATAATGDAAADADRAHKGQLFIALPDGSAQLYKLRGEAGAPECSGQLSVETPAKKAATVILRVKNWLADTQALDVSVNLTEKPTPASFIVAANVTEIGPNGTKEFPLRFISYTEGQSKGTITFTNPLTGEYAFFELTAKTTMPEVLETIAVESPVRQTARYIITVENPLPKDVPVAMGSVAKPADWWSCDSPYVKLNELAALSGNNEGTFEVEYRPLKPTQQPTEHLLTIMTKELGTFKYKLVVKATPPLLKQVLRFDAPLGSMQSESFIFHAYNLASSNYACSVKKPEYFTVQNSLTVGPVAGGWEGEDTRLNVVFEPTVIGEMRDTLMVTSPEGGEYLCELIGNCTAPMPQGPYTVTQGAGPVEIPFRNCFSTSSTWTFSVDSPAFRVSAPTGTPTVNAKTQSQCAVVFEPKEEHMNAAGGVVNAKLFVTCTSMPNIPPWIFYLQGKIDANAGAAPAAAKKK